MDIILRSAGACLSMFLGFGVSRTISCSVVPTQVAHSSVPLTVPAESKFALCNSGIAVHFVIAPDAPRQEHVRNKSEQPRLPLENSCSLLLFTAF